MTEWKEEGDEQQYDTLLAAAAEAEIKTIIPVDAKEFQNPKSMQAAICDYCAAHDLEVPQTKAATTRIVLQSLAAKYAEATAHLNAMLPTPIKKLHIIGGGSQNKLLNRLTEEALGVPVEAGPVEAPITLMMMPTPICRRRNWWQRSSVKRPCCSCATRSRTALR
jgi:rhamnulokinase